MSDFNFKKQFKLILWRETLILNAMRSAFAGLVLGVILFLAGDKSTGLKFVFMGVPVYFIAALPMGLCASFLSGIGVPFAGLFSIFMSLFVIPGDPLVWLLKRMKPEFVPVQSFAPINFSLIVFVLKNEEALNERHIEASPAETTQKNSNEVISDDSFAAVSSIVSKVSGFEAFIMALGVLEGELLEADSKINKYELANALLLKALESELLSKKQEYGAYIALSDVYLSDEDTIDLEKAAMYLKKGIAIANELELDYEEDWKLISRKEGLWYLLNIFSDKCIENNDLDGAFNYCNDAITYTDHPAAHLKIADININRKNDTISARKHLHYIADTNPTTEYFQKVFKDFDEIAKQATVMLNSLNA